MPALEPIETPRRCANWRRSARTPVPGPFDLKKLETERKWNIRYGGLAASRDSADFYFHAPRLSPEYTAADRKAWNDGSAFTTKTMFPQLADISFAGLDRIDTPVFMFLGRHDYTTPSPIAARWLKRLRPPSKSVVWFEHSAHLPFMEEPGRVFDALVMQGTAAQPARDQGNSSSLGLATCYLSQPVGCHTVWCGPLPQQVS